MFWDSGWLLNPDLTLKNLCDGKWWNGNTQCIYNNEWHVGLWRKIWFYTAAKGHKIPLFCGLDEFKLDLRSAASRD
jgi:hypothetical protein